MQCFIEKGMSYEVRLIYRTTDLFSCRDSILLKFRTGTRKASDSYWKRRWKILIASRTKWSIKAKVTTYSCFTYRKDLAVYCTIEVNSLLNECLLEYIRTNLQLILFEVSVMKVVCSLVLKLYNSASCVLI